MKAIILDDEVNQFHWVMLKAVFLVLSVLPVSHLLFSLWSATEGSSQIMVGFFFLSLFSSLLLISFYSALRALEQHCEFAEHEPVLQKYLVQSYRYLPMLSLASLLSYLAMHY